MKRPPAPEDVHLWALVTATVRPLAGRPLPRNVDPISAAVAASKGRPAAAKPAPGAVSPPARAPPAGIKLQPSAGIEPNRRRRIVRGREAFAVRLDLHGFDQDRAHANLMAALVRAQADGARAMLVITGKGVEGGGVLKRRVPEWLGDPRLREVVAGFASADRRHGGEGALYVALKRRG